MKNLMDEKFAMATESALERIFGLNPYTVEANEDGSFTVKDTVSGNYCVRFSVIDALHGIGVHITIGQLINKFVELGA